MQHACQTALNEHAVVVIYARPGIGKSRCLMEFAARQMATAPIAVLCSANVTTRYFVQKVAQALKLSDRAATAELEDRVAEKLKRYPRPLIVDQANYLNEKGLGAICHIWEVARVPVILSGTKALYEKFSSSRLTEEVREQLSSRIALYYVLQELTLAEAKAIIERGLGADATEEAVAQIMTITGGVYRHVDMILPRILQLKASNQQKLAAGQVTMREIIRVAGARLMTGIW